MTGRTKHPGIKKDRPRGVTHRGPGLLKTSSKTSEAVVCRECGLVHHKGVWSHGLAPVGPLRKVLCPACVRVRDRYAAGTITIPATLVGNRRELQRMLRNLEQGENEDHPLERIMGVRDEDGSMVVTTTGVHLARLFAHRLAKHFHVKPRFRYADDEDLVTIDWPLVPGAGPSKAPAPRTRKGKTTRRRVLRGR